ncbi:hypothetical protein [Parapedobacter sp. DT-150]|uniref:hypothetical protein n=1 Tax=Parapedobacter sp. DT-150 TaxID=3396162 RepID=UPI003F1B4408
MLQQFTWQQFGMGAGAVAAVWYLAVLLLYFRTELSRLGAPPGKGAGQHRPASEEPENEDDLMGKAVLPHGMDTVDADGLSFAPALQPEASFHAKRLGVVSDVMQELKTMVMLLQRENGSKEEFYGLFGHIKNTYPAIRESGQLAALTGYLEDHLPFGLTEEEKQTLWD